MGNARIAALLSGGGTTVMNLLRKSESGEMKGRVALAMSSRGPCKKNERIFEALYKRGIPKEVVKPGDFEDTDSFSNRISEVLDGHDIDLVCLAGFLVFWRIPERWLGRVLNIHPALLPKFGGKGFWGRRVHEAVLASGEKESGCTVHFANNEYDAGPVILQKRVPVLDGDTPDTLAKRVFEKEKVAYPEAVNSFVEGRVTTPPAATDMGV